MGRGEEVRVLRSGRDLYFVQTVKDGEAKEGWVPASWLRERGFDEEIPGAEVEAELEAGAEDDIAQDLSSEASEPELARLKETGEGNSQYFLMQQKDKNSKCCGIVLYSFFLVKQNKWETAAQTAKTSHHRLIIRLTDKTRQTDNTS